MQPCQAVLNWNRPLASSVILFSSIIGALREKKSYCRWPFMPSSHGDFGLDVPFTSLARVSSGQGLQCQGCGEMGSPVLVGEPCGGLPARAAAHSVWLRDLTVSVVSRRHTVVFWINWLRTGVTEHNSSDSATMVAKEPSPTKLTSARSHVQPCRGFSKMGRSACGLSQAQWCHLDQNIRTLVESLLAVACQWFDT